MKLEILKEEDFNFFKKEDKKQNKKKISKFSFILFSILILDFTLSSITMINSFDDITKKAKNDFNLYEQLNASKQYDEKNNLKAFNSEDVINGFKNFKPETNIGKFLLFSQYTYFMNDYYQLYSMNQNKEEINKIKNYLQTSIKKEDIDLKKENFNCNYLLHCNFFKLLVQDNMNNMNENLNNKMNKLKFELSHKDEVLSFYKKPVEIQIKMRENKEDPFSKNIW